HHSPAHLHLPSFPTRRSSDLAASRECLLRHRSSAGQLEGPAGELFELGAFGDGRRAQIDEPRVLPGALQNAATVIEFPAAVEPEDRKSTRLNSSHQIISYAVF